MQLVEKTVPITLVGTDSNAFALIATFKRGVRKAGWSQEEIKKVTDEAMKGNYNHLLMTLTAHTED